MAQGISVPQMPTWHRMADGQNRASRVCPVSSPNVRDGGYDSRRDSQAAEAVVSGHVADRQ